MTHRATAANGGRGAHGGIPRIWLLPITLAGVLVFVTAAGFLSRSIILDFVAWWPVWVVTCVVIVLSSIRRARNSRWWVVGPVAATLALVAFTAGHVLGWPAMPSASQSLVGPEDSVQPEAALSAGNTGRINVDGGADFLYVVDPIRFGGDVGLPNAEERTQGTVISVVLQQPDDPGFYAFAGWDISLSNSPSWDLSLDGEVDADLTGLTISGARVSGSGVLTLGQPGGIVSVSVSGNYELVIPPGVPARIVGVAGIPETWRLTDDGSSSAAEGEGWVISVTDGSSVTVNEG